MKYPFILFYRNDKYKYIDTFLKQNANQLNCTLHIIEKKESLSLIFKQVYSLLVIFGDKQEYDEDLLGIITTSASASASSNITNRIIFMPQMGSIEIFNEIVNTLYINICSFDRIKTRPVFSIFTPTFNSFEKVLRAFNSLKQQTMTDWEWVIMDDSPDDKNFKYLRENCLDPRVRLYRRSENNGYIGNIKNEAVGLCRGQYVLELDHDDEVLPFVLKESCELFEKEKEVGFIYMDFINLYENGENFRYGDFICKGYGSYYSQKYKDKWVYVYVTPNINNITLSHLVCCPNHPRIWRRDVLLAIGNYCELLPICDDYEILLRTALNTNTKMAKIHKMGYIQYMNNENNNFSLIRNAEINRIGPQYISPIYYNKFNIHEEMKKRGAYEDEKYLFDCPDSILWKRDADYEPQYCNLLVNPSYKKQFCIIGLDGLLSQIDRIRELYQDSTNDFLLVENKCTIEYLWSRMDALKFESLERMKCYTLMDESEEGLVKYFMHFYKSVNDYEIITSNIQKLKYNTTFGERHTIIHLLTKPSQRYLEIGVENGYTFLRTHFLDKVGIDPDPKIQDEGIRGKIHKCTSDEYFERRGEEGTEGEGADDETKDVVFIDGMHHCENVLRDFVNSQNILSEDGIIFIDDCIPLNYNEQLKIPLKHYYENGVLKYGEEWTGDVWKFIYYLLKQHKDKIDIRYFHHLNYRGVVSVKIKTAFVVNISYHELNQANYFEHFNEYLGLLMGSNGVGHEEH